MQMMKQAVKLKYYYCFAKAPVNEGNVLQALVTVGLAEEIKAVVHQTINDVLENYT